MQKKITLKGWRRLTITDIFNLIPTERGRFEYAASIRGPDSIEDDNTTQVLKVLLQGFLRGSGPARVFDMLNFDQLVRTGEYFCKKPLNKIFIHNYNFHYLSHSQAGLLAVLGIKNTSQCLRNLMESILSYVYGKGTFDLIVAAYTLANDEE